MRFDAFLQTRVVKNASYDAHKPRFVDKPPLWIWAFNFGPCFIKLVINSMCQSSMTNSCTAEQMQLTVLFSILCNSYCNSLFMKIIMITSFLKQGPVQLSLFSPSSHQYFCQVLSGSWTLLFSTLHKQKSLYTKGAMQHLEWMRICKQFRQFFCLFFTKCLSLLSKINKISKFLLQNTIF